MPTLTQDDNANIELIKGADFEMTVTNTGVDITGFTATFKIREKPGGKTLWTGTVGSGVTLTTPASGLYTINITDVETATFRHTDGGRPRYFYDFIQNDGSVKTMLAEGRVHVSESISG